ncbi:hypothetical protein MYP_1819 [Sporocytophaga myxococcoides]|uniref:Uncharacterized protein n=1 Tax=Sporocytophaga myxococcoides TaxID=153721 RepID=A0A098LC94_9BACT|nr:hypothetical protein [Sporocytophaga myxococcoides]GAL84591.1 hypothetical protein MYP_1819 [Sporocytophaga myxococcoides]
MENPENKTNRKEGFRKPLTIFEAIKNIPSEETSGNIEVSSKEKKEKKTKERTFKDFLFPTWMLF